MTAILSVTKREGYTLVSENEPRILYHSRKGLTPDRSKATRFKTVNHAVKVARQRYSPRLAYLNAPEGTFLSRDLVSWSASDYSMTQD